MTVLERKDVPELYQLKTLGFELSLHLAKVLASDPKSSQNAALLTLLFCQLREYDYLKTLEQWLWSRATTFIDKSPRDQPNQLDKVLIIACCVYSRITTDKNLEIHQKKNLDAYISYAAEQNWFDDPFLAFYCYKIAEELPVCNMAVDFFQKNFTRFIERKNIPAIVQSLLVLGDKIGELEKKQCYMVFTENWRESSVFNQGWILLGSSKSQDSSVVAMSLEVAQNVTNHLNDYVGIIANNSLVLDALFLLDKNISQIEIDKYSQSLQIPMTLHLQNDELVIRLPIKEYTKANAIELSSLFILLLSLSVTEWHEFTGVSKADKEKLISIVDEAKIAKGAIKNITPLDMFIANILTISATFIIGLIVFGFFMNADIDPPQFDFSQSDWRNIDVIGGAVGVGIIALILTQLRALVTGNSAISYWLQITPIRQLIALFKAINIAIRK